MKKRYSYLIKPLQIVFDVLILNIIFYLFYNRQSLDLFFLGYITIYWLITSYFFGFYKVFRYTRYLRLFTLLIKQLLIFFLGYFAYFGVYREGGLVDNQVLILAIISLILSLNKFLWFFLLKKYRALGNNLRTTVVLGFLVFYLFHKYFNKMNNSVTEEFYDDHQDDVGETGLGLDDDPEHTDEDSGEGETIGPAPTTSYVTEEFADYSGTGNENNQYPKDCFPKDQLTPSELLPGNGTSQFAQLNPSANEGELGDQNFLQAGYHTGVNTVGQTLRNANYQVRSEPPNPQLKVSPWLQTTIEPDTNRKPLEIGGDCN